MFWFIILLLVVGAGFYFYQKMMAIEQEIRSEQEVEKASVSAEPGTGKQSEGAPQNTVFDSGEGFSPAVPEPVEPTTLEATILAEVVKKPGIKQTELYSLFADTNKKQLQQLIKEMADKDVLRREKEGSSFLLYSA